MSNFDHHDAPYDEGTRKKLEIYKRFLQAWVQVFLHTKAVPGPLRFFDFFSGPGQDNRGTPGSPLILMDELEQNRDLVARSGRSIDILFNDLKVQKSEALRELCAKRGYSFVPRIESKDFLESYHAHRASIGRSPSFVLLDQCGVKFVTRAIFQDLAKRGPTDVLFFFASSAQRRFSEEFANEIQIPTTTPYWEVHRRVADCFRAWAPKGYFVGQYSIMKGSNIYGLVFGSRHWLGMYKFLTTDSGEEANYEIDIDAKQGDLFHGHKLTKIEQLAEELEKRIEAGNFRTDGDVALHCLEQGILPSRVATEVYRKLKAGGVLAQNRELQPRSSSEAINHPRPLVLEKR